MKDNFTYVVYIVDKSGSMAFVSYDVIGGINTFVKEQKYVPGKCCFTLVEFNENVSTVYDGIDIHSVPEYKTYRPNGWTALNDAIGLTIVNVGKKLESMPESERPSKVLFIVQTDGQENKSKEYIDSTAIAAMIKHQEEKYSWDFVFVGAGKEAFEQHKNLGFKSGMSFNYAPSKAGTGNIMRALSANTTKYRSNNAKGADFFNQP